MCRLVLVHSWKWLLTISPMASPSLWLRERSAQFQVSKRRTILNFHVFVLTTKAPSRDLHQPDSMRTTSPTFTPLNWSDQNTKPTKPVSSRPQAAPRGRCRRRIRSFVVDTCEAQPVQADERVHWVEGSQSDLQGLASEARLGVSWPGNIGSMFFKVFAGFFPTHPE